MERTDVTFDSSGERCAAWLYTPDTPAPRPCVVMAHGFGGTRVARLDAFAERFAAAGLSALVFDYRHFGDSGGEPRQEIDIGRQLDDWRSAIEFARSFEDVDPERVAAWGTSFSGGHVATIAAEDHRLAAAISQGPMMSGIWALRAAGPRNMAKLTVAALRDVWARVRGRPPYTIAVVGPPGSLSAMNSPDAEPGYRALFKDQSEFRNEVTARFGLPLGLYRPVRVANRIACPWLVCICERDVVTPPQPAFAAAARAPKSEVRTYDVGHFDIYVGETFQRAVADQVAFLERHLLSRGQAAAWEAATAS